MRARNHAEVAERAVFAVMRDLAARSRSLAADAARYEQELAELVCALAPTLLEEVGVGPISAAKLLACDPVRFKSEELPLTAGAIGKGIEKSSGEEYDQLAGAGSAR